MFELIIESVEPISCMISNGGGIKKNKNPNGNNNNLIMSKLNKIMIIPDMNMGILNVCIYNV